MRASPRTVLEAGIALKSRLGAYKVMITRAAVLIASHSGKGQREVKNKAEADRRLLPVPYYCLMQQDNLFSRGIYLLDLALLRYRKAHLSSRFPGEVSFVAGSPSQHSWAASADGMNSFLASLAVSASCHPSNGTKRINKRPQPVKIDTREAGVEKNMAS